MMTKKIMIPTGIVLILLSTLMFFSGLIWPWGWVAGVSLIGFSFFIIKPSDPKQILNQNYKNKLSVDYNQALKIIANLCTLTSPWHTKRDIEKLKTQLSTIQNMQSASITYKYGESLITSLKVSFTKSKDNFIVTVQGEGKESIEMIEKITN